MSCSSLDWKAYLLGEISERERAALEAHVRACRSCHEELERLRLTQSALLTLPDEEIPQRIAFVSDKIFEPRWWQRVWRSGPAMGFASAVILSVAILLHGFVRPVGAPVAPAVDTAKVAAAKIDTAKIDAAQIDQRIDEEVNARVAAAVREAVAQSEARQDQKFAKVLETAEKRYEFQRRADLATLQQTVRYYDQQMGRLMVASNDVAPERTSR